MAVHPGSAFEDAERFLSQGDYVRALLELESIVPFDPQVAQLIHQTLERMKLVGAQEFAVGRWSVAEAILEALGEHERFLSVSEREECRNLVREIEHCRGSEGAMHAIVQSAARLAAEGHFLQSREIALEAMKACEVPRQVARLRHHLRGLPHPLGGLIYGFDSPLEIQQFAWPRDGAQVEPVLDESHTLGGGFADVTLPGEGSGLVLGDPPPDWSEFRELSFCVQLVAPSRATLRILVGDQDNSWTIDVPLTQGPWHLPRLELDRFEKRSEPRWSSVTRFRIDLASPGPAEIFLDEIRLRPRTS